MTKPGGKSDRTRSSTRPLDAPHALVGRVLDGRFRLERVLKSGGMGLVFEATQLSVKRTVAIKILKPTLLGDADLMQRFSQEVDIATQLEHPNIVPLVDAGCDASGLIYLVMEFFRGGTFRDFLQQKKLTLIEILEVFIQMCNALIEAHEHDIIHRDLKFDNIMLKRHKDGSLHVKILDFGVAKILGSDVELTRQGQILGTPGIIAPELIEHQRPSPQSDLYSLGVLVYTVLAGDMPFHGHNELELMRAHKQDPVPVLESHVQEYVPEAFIELAYQLLAKNPASRPKNAWVVRDSLVTIKKELMKRYRDMPIYVPSGLRKEAQNSEVMGHLQPFWGVHKVPELPKADPHLHVASDEVREPLLVPTSVVGALALVLLILFIIIIALLQRIFL